jgi:hypothetical protein
MNDEVKRMWKEAVVIVGCNVTLTPWTATLTWWEGLCLFDVKKADQRQSEIK